MKHLSTIIITIFTLTNLSAQDNAKFLQDLSIDVVYLASDYLEGRETGKKGETLAAQYIIRRFEAIGLTPKGTESWLQPFMFTHYPNPHSKENGQERTGKNVIGYLDNQAEHTIVIGAHYDHLGMGSFGSLYKGVPAVHNGADDNASGIAALIKLAELLKASTAKNNNYLFIAFSGEELGLIGSKYFTNHPTVDLSKVTYMLNMDMVGRLKADKVLAINGVGTSPAWKAAIKSVETDLNVKTTEGGIGPSDHASFYFKDIPALHFFTGQHQAYHKPIDDSHDINYKGIQSVVLFMKGLIEQLNDEAKLTFTKPKEPENTRKVSKFKVSLGVMPDYVYEGKGMKVDAVIEDRPAAKGGLKDGDVIIKIGDKKVKDIYDYMEGLSLYKKGDTVKVVVKRGKKKVTRKVTF